MTAATWMEMAWAELGQSEIKGPIANPRIRAMFADAGHPHTVSDEVPWCAAFVGAVLTRSGIKPTGSLMARSYLAWGAPLQVPREGCIVVLTRGSNPAAGHVGFFVGSRDGYVTVLGGNQSDRVSVQDFSEAGVLGYRWPTSVAAAPVQPAPQQQSEDAVVVDRTAPEPSRAPRPWWDLVAVSRTIRGGLWQALGGTLLVMQGWVETLLAGIAEATRLEPIAAVLGKNVPAIGAGLVVWGTIVVIMRRIKDEATR